LAGFFQKPIYIGFGGLFSKANLHRFWRAFFKSQFTSVLAGFFQKPIFKSRFGPTFFKGSIYSK